MVAMFEDRCLDYGLVTMKNEATHLYICSAEPTTYAIATTSGTLGYKSWGAGAVLTGPAAGTTPTGRKNTTVAITDGTITTSGTASWWAVCNVTGTALCAHGSLSASQVVTAGNTFSLAAFDLKLADQ